MLLTSDLVREDETAIVPYPRGTPFLMLTSAMFPQRILCGTREFDRALRSSRLWLLVDWPALRNAGEAAPNPQPGIVQVDVTPPES